MKMYRDEKTQGWFYLGLTKFLDRVFGQRLFCYKICIYAPPWGLSSLAKELPAAASVMQSSSKELSTLVADRV